MRWRRAEQARIRGCYARVCALRIRTCMVPDACVLTCRNTRALVPPDANADGDPPPCCCAEIEQGTARSPSSRTAAKRRQQRERAAARKQKEHRKLEWLLDKYARGWRKRKAGPAPVPSPAIGIAEFDPVRARLEVRLQIKLDQLKQLRSGGVIYWFRPLRTAQFRLAKNGTGVLGKILPLSAVAAAVCNGDVQQVCDCLATQRSLSPVHVNDSGHCLGGIKGGGSWGPRELRPYLGLWVRVLFSPRAVVA